MNREDFQRAARAAWVAAIQEAVGANPPRTSVWEGPEAIRKALIPFMGRNANHAHLPTGGGRDFHAVEHSRESGCLDFEVDEHSVYRAKAERLTLEYISEAPAESFLLLESGTLKPVLGNARDRQEELLELSGGERLDRDVWDRGFLDYDDEGREIPIPDDARIVVRWFGGKFLIITKGSMWNGDSGTYDGRHDRMSADDIRSIIIRSLD